MNNHIVVINAPKSGTDKYFERFCRQVRENHAHDKTPIVLINPDYPLGLPEYLDDMGVRLVEGRGVSPQDWQQANIDEAEHIVVLAKDDIPEDSDSVCFDICHRLSERGLSYRVIVECFDDDNRERFKSVGVKSVLRPIRSYPEVIVRALESPGAELIVEDMFTRAEDHFKRFPLWLEGDLWRDVVQAMMLDNLGTPMAAVSKEGEVMVHPRADQAIYAQSIIMLVKTAHTPAEAQVHDAFRRYISHDLSA